MMRVEEALSAIDLPALRLDDYKVVGPLSGGMNNSNYLIEARGRKYIVYLPTPGCNELVDRKAEHFNLRALSSWQETGANIYHDIESGVKINEYIPGYSLDNSGGRPYVQVAALLKKLHRGKIRLYGDYDPFKRLSYYEKEVKLKGVSVPKKYGEARAYLGKFKEYLTGIKKVPAHNDAQPSNFVENENGLFLIDFEFAANNDWIYDIACFGNIDFQDALKLLYVYDGGRNYKDHLKRLYLWRIFQCLQWYNVALTKLVSGLNAVKTFDFKIIAQNYLNLALSLIDEAKKIIE